MAYDRPATEADIARAQWDMFARQPEFVQRALSSVPRDSDAYNQALWALRGQETDPQSQVLQVGTDGQRQLFTRERSPSQVGMASLPGMSTNMQLTALRALGVPEEALAGLAPQRPARATRSGPDPNAPLYNVGSVNGKAVMAPTAGNYQNVLALRASLGLGDSTDLGLEEFNAASSAASRAQAQQTERERRLRRQEKHNDRQAEHTNAVDLERVKLGLKPGDTGRKELEQTHRDRVEQWRKDQIRSQQLAQMVAGLPDVDQETGTAKMVTDAQGNLVTVSSLRAQAAALNYQQPRYADTLLEIGTPDSMAELGRVGKGNLEPESQATSPEAQRQAWSELSPEDRQRLQRNPEQKKKWQRDPGSLGAAKKADRESTFARLTPERRAAYNSWTQEQREAYWRGLGL